MIRLLKNIKKLDRQIGNTKTYKTLNTIANYSLVSVLIAYYIMSN